MEQVRLVTSSAVTISQFGGLGQTVEECRAESCGLYLCYNRDLLKIFGFDEKKGDDVGYVNWLAMARKVSYTLL